MGLRGESKEEKEKNIMRTRTRKMLSLLLATAMVFTLNTSVWAVEIGDDEATVDAIVTDNVDVAEVDAADLAADDEKDPVKKLEAAGWTVTVKEKTGLKSFDDKNKLTLSDNTAITSLVGDTDTSADITIEASANDPDKGLVSSNLLYGLKVNAGIDPAGSVTVTLLSNNQISTGDPTNGTMTGYAYIGTAAPGEKESNVIKSDDDVKAWAQAACGEGNVTVAVDDSKAKGKGGQIVLTFSFDVDGAKENNIPYGEVTTKIGDATVVYYKNIPYFGSKITAAGVESLLKMKISGNSTTYSIKKIKIKIAKKSNQATLKSIKLDGGDAKARKALQKQIKAANISFTIYPYNVENGSLSKAKGSGKAGKYKLTGTINGGGKFTVKEGKTDKLGGNVQIKRANGTLILSGNAIVGTLSENKLTKNKLK